jgi:hypothetical protein
MWLINLVNIPSFSMLLPCYQDNIKAKRKKVVGLERGPFSLVSTTEELLDGEVAAPV